MIQWKQRLYAFLLRRILGPFLDASSYQKLHDSIDVSLQEGTFILKDIGLNSAYLTEKIALRTPGLVIRKARVEHLEISLTLRENAEENDLEGKGDSEVPQSSFAWRAMKFGTSSAAFPAVSLMAEIKIDGICLELEAGDYPNRQRPTIPSNKTEATDEQPSSRSLIGSYVDAALASLELSLSLTRINVTVRQKNADKSREAWVGVRLSSISYQDLERNKEAAGSRNIFQKVIKCSEVEIQTGEHRVGEDVVEKTAGSTIALARGSGQVQFRLFEYGDGESSAKCHVQQDIEVKVNHQLHVSLDMKSISQIKNVLDGLAMASKVDNKNYTTAISQTSLAGSPLDIDDVTDQEDLKALTGIMKQYREAYHLAEKNQLKGGVLIPSNAYSDGIPLFEEEDAGSFDIFFDANDQSFYNATSVLAESVRIQETDKGADDLVHTKVRFHLLSMSMKLVFGAPDWMHYSRPTEYILLTMDDLNLSHVSSNSSVESILSIGHLQVEDAQLDNTSKQSSGFVSIGSAPVFEGVVDIGTLVAFSLDSEGEKNDLLVFDAPCVSLNVNRKTKGSLVNSIKCDATVLPLEVCIRQRTLSNISAFAADLRAQTETELQSAKPVGVTLETTRSQHLSLQCSCPSIAISIPLVQDVSTSLIFERNGEILNNAPMKRPSLGILLENTAFEWRVGPTVGGCDNLEEAGRFLCNNMLFFAQSPVGDRVVLDATIQRTDFLMARGRSEVNPCIPISIELKRNVGDDNVGRDSFPLVPAISSFKARQEDDDEDIKIDRLLFSKLNDVNADSRKELRGSDPQFTMIADAKKAQFAVVVTIPEIAADFTTSEIDSLLNILSATKVESSQNHASATTPSQYVGNEVAAPVCFAVNVSKITVALIEEPAADKLHHQNIFSLVFAIDNFAAHALLNASSLKNFRVMAREPCLYQVDRTVAPCEKQKSIERTVRARIDSFGQRIRSVSNGNVSPIFYRSHQFTPISNDSPTFLLDFMDLSSAKQIEIRGFAEKRLHVTFYHFTYRFDIDSKWIQRVAGMLPKSNLREPETTTSQCSDEKSDGIHSMTKVYFSLADFNLDYTPPKYFDTTSRSILRIGDFRFSSNIMKPSIKTQAYSLSVGDLAFHVCNNRYPYDHENSLLCRSSLMWSSASEQKPKPTTSASMPTPETLLRELGFVSVLSLDMMDAIVVAREKTGGSTPKLMTSLTFGTLSMNACKDAFSCFATTVGELNAKLTALTDDDIKALTTQTNGSSSANASRQKLGTQGIAEPSTPTPGLPESHSTKKYNSEDDINLLDGYEWTAIDHDPLPEPAIPDGDEQVAGWYNSSVNAASKGLFVEGTITPQIVQQHFPLNSISDPLSDGDMGATKLAGDGSSVVLKSRLMIHQLTVKFRFYDGYDWPTQMSQEQCKAASQPDSSFVIETLPEVERLKLKDELSKKGGGEESKKAKLLGDLLASTEEMSLTFSSTPLPEERATNIELKEKVRRFSRKSHLFFQLSANGATLRIDSFDKDKSHRLVSILALSVSDLFIAETASGPSPIKMLGEWVNDNEHPHDSRFGTLMFKMVTWHPENPITPENEVESDDCEVTVQLLPMRCILDQRAINFIRSFFYSEETEIENSEKWSAGLHYLPPPRFRAFRVKPWKLKVDYLPQKLDIGALREGSFVELINVSPIDAMVITLSQACVESVVGFGLVGSGLVRSWVQEICATQLHKFLVNARPFEPFADVGQGVTDLIVLPYEAFKNGEDIRHAMGSGIKSLAETFAFQTLTTTSRLTQYAANKMAGRVRGRRRVNVGSNPLPSRPSAAPKGVGDVTGHAMESLARGFQAANYKVVIVPYREYARNGATGAVTSVMKGVPVLLVAPLTGATEALSYTLLGARNALRPDIRKEEEAIRNGITGYDI